MFITSLQLLLPKQNELRAVSLFIIIAFELPVKTVDVLSRALFAAIHKQFIAIIVYVKVELLKSMLIFDLKR